jgi:ribosomal protein S18 acetylase RimI-like enzyme
MRDVIIRKGTIADLSSVLELIKELAEYEKAPNEVTNTVADMEREMSASNPVFDLLVAEKNNDIVGIAVYFMKYSTWKGRGVYLDDIVVKSKYRGQGLGKMLFDKVLDEARKLNAKQVHWQVLDWNEPAINFYKKYHSSFDNGWVDCKLNEGQLNQLG